MKMNMRELSLVTSNTKINPHTAYFSELRFPSKQAMIPIRAKTRSAVGQILKTRVETRPTQKTVTRFEKNNISDSARVHQ